MPELPEVETIRRDLVKTIKNKKIKKVTVKVPKMVNFLVPQFKRGVYGNKIVNVLRRAKLIIFELSNKKYVVIHLKLTGQLIYRKKDGKVVAVGGHPIKQDLEKLPNKFSHAIFEFSDGSHLFFNDMRKFGYMKLLDKDGLIEMESKYGPEPLLSKFSVQQLGDILSRRKKMKIKQLLLDQKLIAGIGNIYADESLFCAGIDPRRPASKVNAKEVKKLHSCIIKILKLAVAKRGSSVQYFVDASGKQGGMVPYLKVYGRKGEPCKKCSKPIKKIKLNGRGTHYCEKCQE